MSFRAGLLDGRRVAVSGSREELPGTLSALGADVVQIPAAIEADEDGLATWTADHAPLGALVHDTRWSFGAGGADGLRSALDHTWICARAVASAALIPGGDGGRLVFVAPEGGTGPLAQAAGSALENLARTLSVEWARHGVNAVAVCPGATTSAEEITGLVAFLLSEAGGYFTGCRFDLGGVAKPLISGS